MCNFTTQRIRFSSKILQKEDLEQDNILVQLLWM